MVVESSYIWVFETIDWFSNCVEELDICRCCDISARNEEQKVEKVKATLTEDVYIIRETRRMENLDCADLPNHIRARLKKCIQIGKTVR